jgi:hypothetical protein
MGSAPGHPFPYGAKKQPSEHVLQLPPSILGTMRAAAEAMGTNPQCKVFDEFVIQPVYKCGFDYP